eukprot:SAG31_NODE_2405_length_5763_cov_4.872881_1_plen_809_part_10
METSPAVQERIFNDRAHRKGFVEFRKFANDDGVLCEHGWKEVMRELNIYGEYGKRFGDIDIDRNKFIDNDEFMKFWQANGAGTYKDTLKADREKLKLATAKPMKDASDIQELLDAVDENGDGIYSREEVEAVLRDMIDLKKGAKRMKRALIGMGLLVALLIAMMMTTSFLGNELAKDMRPGEGSSALKTNDGNTVQTQPEQISLDIYQLPTQSVHTLENIQHMTIPVLFDEASDFADVHYTIAGWYRTSDSLQLLTSVGDTISINAREARLSMANGSSAVIGGGPGSGRRQLQAGSNGNIVATESAPTTSESTDACSAMPCLNDGACWPIDDEQYTCNCEGTGYSGTNCQTAVDECASTPCQNAGECIDGDNSYACSCVNGFVGSDCESDVDECASGPCPSFATCNDGSGAYTCVCPTGLSGEHCEIDVDDCLDASCANDAVCVDLTGGFICQCPDGFSGTTCETDIDECASEPCANDGVCTDGVASYTCACAAGWELDNCDGDIDECASIPCNNDAVCSDSIDGWSCACLPGWSGEDCDESVNPCASGEAECDEDNAECVHVGPGLWTCDCNAGYGTSDGGQTCIEINECDSLPCANGGLCLNLVADFACTCALGYSGRYCGNDADECGSAPCVHGTCTDFGHSYHCKCDAGWASDNCDVNIDDCAAMPCENGGFCTDGLTGFSCSCAFGYSGDTCETDIDECASSPCLNGGLCFDEADGFTCLCEQYYDGDRCEVAPGEEVALDQESGGPRMLQCDPMFNSGDDTVEDGSEEEKNSDAERKFLQLYINESSGNASCVCRDGFDAELY